MKALLRVHSLTKSGRSRDKTIKLQDVKEIDHSDEPPHPDTLHMARQFIETRQTTRQQPKRHSRARTIQSREDTEDLQEERQECAGLRKKLKLEKEMVQDKDEKLKAVEEKLKKCRSDLRKVKRQLKDLKSSPPTRPDDVIRMRDLEFLHDLGLLVTDKLLPHYDHY